MDRPKQKIGVVGAGTMGCGIAEVAATAGHEVVVIDASADALEQASMSFRRSLATQSTRGKVGVEDAERIASLVTWSTNLSSASNAVLLIEAIVERLDIKQGLFADLVALTTADTILASNTSSLSIDAIANCLPDPGRLVGVHFFNPVPVMPLVEIVAGPRTDPLLVTRAAAMMREWGKHPVIVRDLPGFIVNRIARPFYAEAFMAWDEGLAPDDIDLALKGAGGFKMGPLALADMIGHDVNYVAAKTVFDALQPNTRFRPQPIQQRLVEQGRLGRKSKSGVFDYPHSALKVQPITASHAQEILVGADADAFNWSNARMSSTVPDGCIRVDDVVMTPGDGRMLRERPDVDVLLDDGLDPAGTSVLVATARNAHALDAAYRLAARYEKSLVAVPDRPGQLVLRTWCQIANAAADALRDEVASADAIDEAMRFGANYPLGPLEWARRRGVASIKRVLGNIRAATRDPIYDPSDGFDLL